MMEKVIFIEVMKSSIQQQGQQDSRSISQVSY